MLGELFHTTCFHLSFFLTYAKKPRLATVAYVKQSSLQNGVPYQPTQNEVGSTLMLFQK